MGLFKFFRGKAAEMPVMDNTVTNEIPKDIFIEEAEPQDQFSDHSSNGQVKGIELIYQFLQADYEAKGYSDALTNEDESYKNDNIKLFKQDLIILVQKVTTYYEDLLTEIDYHIDSRSRAGLIDLVEELKSRKKMITEHLDKVREIQQDAINQTGMCERIILSYQRGFMRGLSAITQSKVLNRTL